MQLPALLAASAIALSSLVAAQPPAPADDAREGTILYFNDAHDVRPVLTGGEDRGGVARLDAAIAGVRAEDPETRVVFGGDLAGGTLFGGLYKGFPLVDAFNTIGIDLANLGQHDFDFGVENTRELIAASEFPWITSNLLDDAGQPFLPDSTWAVHETNGITVGYIGLVDGMDTTSVGDAVVELDHVEAAVAAVADLEAAASPDVIIAVAQVPPAVGERLVDALPQLDAVLLEEQAEYESVITEYKGAVLASPEGNMGSLIRLDVAVGAAGEVSIEPSVIEVDHTVTPTPSLRELELQYDAEIEESLSHTLATVETPLLNPDHQTRRGESLIGNFVADAFRDYHGTQIGWMNGGGIRAEVPGPEFTLRDAYSIAPFDNKVMHIEVLGSGIRQSLEDAVMRMADLGGGFPQVSGMSFGVDPDAPVGERIHSVMVAGQPLDDNATYSVAVTNYVVNGGDSVSGFADANVVVPASEAPADAEVIAEYAAQLGVIDLELEGRITVGAAPETPAPTATPSPTATPTPTVPAADGGDDDAPQSDGADDGSLAATGGDSMFTLAALGGAVLVLGAALWALARRRGLTGR